MKLLVYSHKLSNRLKYVVNLFFKDLGKLDVELTMDKTQFDEYEGPKLTYSYRTRENSLFLKCNDLLFETGIKDHPVRTFPWNNSVAFFETDNTSDVPFDCFAAAFFLVTRYEEYLPHIRDHYDRFDAQMSLAYKNDFLDKALVNRWANYLFDLLEQRFPSLKIERLQYEVKTTIDIDNAYAYLEKGLMRTAGGLAKSLFSFNFKELTERIQVLTGIKKDPYDSYDYQKAMHEKWKIPFIYFFLLADYGVNDKNIPYHSARFQRLIKSLTDFGIAGIHPSFGSNSNPRKLEKEIERLSGIVNREVKHSRQHFLKLHLPDTYRRLIELGIENDYTMGYAFRPGFRAGIASPYYFYDIDMEMETSLKVHPFAVMEGTIKYYMKLGPESAMEVMRPLVDEVKQVGGTFISLWHNDSISETDLWKGWRGIFEELHEYAIQK